MNKFVKTLTLCLTATLAQMNLAQGSATQQDADPLDGWYEINFAVFAHRAEGAQFEESWRNQLQLKYPPNLIRLKTQTQYLHDLCGPAAQSGANKLVDVLEKVDSGQAYNPNDPACQPKDTAQTAVAEAQTLINGGISGPVRPPTPFILGDLDDPDFAEKVKKIKGAYRYHLLFSGSWAEAPKARDKAIPILIQGGAKTGSHYELEGYIKIALERYLHIETNLWLSTFSQNSRGSDLAAQRNNGIEVIGQQNNVPIRQQNNPMADSIPEDTGFPALPLPFPVNDPGSQRAIRAQQRASEENRPASNLDALMMESGYHVERTVVLHQTRRMRSGEIHYLDHPLFGVLIKITPIKAPKSN